MVILRMRLSDNDFLDRHSSSSAIFERDIEPLGLPSLSVPLQAAPTASSPLRSSTNTGSPTPSVNPHRIPRSKTTEALELTVPSVLDSAVSALSAVEETGANITVLSPIPAQPLAQSLGGSAVQSPLSLQSQPSPLSAQFNQPQPMGSGTGTSAGSPSPPTMSLLLQGMGMSGLVSASASVSGAASASGFQSGFASPLSSSRAPSPARSASPPNGQVTIEPSASAIGGSPRSIPKDATPSIISASPRKRPSIPAPGPASNPNIPSPNMRASNRLSFISYTDLLTSAPIAAQPLGAVLNPGTHEPPTHLVVVDPDNAPSLLGITPTVSSGHLPLGSLNMSGAADKIDVDSLGTVGLSSTGEWGREGLGSGLEERLERLWVAEKELNERGRVAIPVSPSVAAARSSASRSASIGGTNSSPPAPIANALPPLQPPTASAAPSATT
ncbi:hypothetical protein PIIN_03868 [Serendipita indica DSM 11827]|uniref:Uncharacterized protein n=1 Tax=Serendipita indica (strain DSM 11827) TaxID=1109443 RepID=G4TF32_SERID|nr:hypothetical protein PIIN_03868 [Serendipita indica DSM 11827]